MKTLKVLVLVVSLVVGIGIGFLEAQTVTKKPLEVPEVTLSMIKISQPQAGTRWSIGLKYEIHYKLINIKTPHWVKLLRNGEYLGNFAGGNNTGTIEIKLAVTCGQPLLNGVKYGPGDSYKIEIATTDNKIKAQSEPFSIVSLQLKPTGTPESGSKVDKTIEKKL